MPSGIFLNGFMQRALSNLLFSQKQTHSESQEIISWFIFLITRLFRKQLNPVVTLAVLQASNVNSEGLQSLVLKVPAVSMYILLCLEWGVGGWAGARVGGDIGADLNYWVAVRRNRLQNPLPCQPNPSQSGRLICKRFSAIVNIGCHLFSLKYFITYVHAVEHVHVNQINNCGSYLFAIWD